jgi:hypothetical protein
VNEIAIFETDEDRFEVRLEGEALWTTQAQMAELFDSTTDNIGLHLKNIYAESERDEAATTKIFSVVRQEGTCRVRRRLRHYNLDDPSDRLFAGHAPTGRLPRTGISGTS